MTVYLQDIVKDEPGLTEIESRLVDYAEQLEKELEELEKTRPVAAVSRGSYGVADCARRTDLTRPIVFRRSIFTRRDGVELTTTDELLLDESGFTTALDLVFSFYREHVVRKEVEV